MTDNPATEEFYADHEGNRYFFCCDECVQDFLSDPSRFVALDKVIGFPLDQLNSKADSSNEPETPLQHFREPEGFEAFIDSCFDASRWISRTWSSLHLNASSVLWRAFVTLGLIAWPIAAWCYRRWSNKKAGVGASKTKNHLGWFKRAVWLALALLAVDSCYQSFTVIEQTTQTQEVVKESSTLKSHLQSLEDQELEEQIHFATFINNGFPPRPRRDTHENSLRATYYRGNDERFDTMFNGGQYLTVTFSLFLENDKGEVIENGQAITGDVTLVVRFERAKDTSNGYYSEDYMAKMYLTMKGDRFLGRDAPVTDRIPWIETEPSKVWEGRYPLPKGDSYPREWSFRRGEPLGPSDRRGVVYLVEERELDGKVVGGRYHYAVEYCLRTKDGIVTNQSDLFMAATYRGRNFADYQITDEQWLSRKPIPEKP